MGFPETFKALSDPVRREILTLLKGGSLSAGDIAAHFDITSASISYHLSILKKADLVYEERRKNFIYYDLNVSVFEEIMLWLSQFSGGKVENEFSTSRFCGVSAEETETPQIPQERNDYNDEKEA